MYIGFYSYHNLYNNNRLLTDSSSPIGDNLNYPFVLLAQRLKEMGHSVATLDTDDIRKFDAIIFVEFPGRSNPYFKKTIQNNFKNLYLLILESPIIKLDNYIKENHTYFKKIFTWSDELVDNKKYFKIQYSHNIPTEFNFGLEKKEKLCTIISSNKNRHHPKELYSERIKAIRWFESNHPEDFNLYGNGWDRHHFEGTFLGIKIARLNRLKFLTKLLRPYYPSYKGGVVSKRATYQKYKFSICYENCKDFNGYITEKIFDCLLSGCVPVYLGAQNIADHIPKNVFIDKRNFNTYDQLYSYMKNMPDKEYQDYLDNIKNFLLNDKGYLFSTKHFANTLVKEILS